MQAQDMVDFFFCGVRDATIEMDCTFHSVDDPGVMLVKLPAGTVLGGQTWVDSRTGVRRPSVLGGARYFAAVADEEPDRLRVRRALPTEEYGERFSGIENWDPTTHRGWKLSRPRTLRGLEGRMRPCHTGLALGETMNLPSGYELVYIVSHEAWYRDVVAGRPRPR